MKVRSQKSSLATQQVQGQPTFNLSQNNKKLYELIYENQNWNFIKISHHKIVLILFLTFLTVETVLACRLPQIRQRVGTV